MSIIEHLSPTVTICHGPTMEESSRESMGVKWCFKCRTRNEFQWVVMSPVIDWNDEATIYAAHVGADRIQRVRQLQTAWWRTVPRLGLWGDGRMKPFAFVDGNNNTLAFHNGTISTVGPVTLTPDAARNLASKLLQYSSQNTVGVRREYVPASEYRGLPHDAQ